MSSPIDFVTGSSSTSGISSPSTTSTPLSVVSDSISSSAGTTSIPLLTLTPQLVAPAKEVNLSSYLNATSNARLALQDTIIDFENSIRQKNLEIIGSLSSGPLTLIQNQAQLNALFAEEQALYRDQLYQAISYNSDVIAPYNAFLETLSTSVTKSMYDTQVKYKAGELTAEEYNQAVDDWMNSLLSNNAELQAKYDAYAQATAVYNTKILADNNTIDKINADRKALGITEFVDKQSTVALSPLIQLPALNHNPDITTLPNVPETLPEVPDASEATSISTEFSISDVSPEEQALLDSITDSLDAINNGPGKAYNTALVAANAQVAAMQKAISDFSQGLIDKATYDAAVTTYQTYAQSANATLSALGANYLSAVNAYNNSIPAINDQIDYFNQFRFNKELLPDQIGIIAPSASSFLLPTSMPTMPSPPAANPFDNGPFVVLPQVPTSSHTPVSNSLYLIQFYISQAQAAQVVQARLVVEAQNREQQTDFNIDDIKSDSTITPHGAPSKKAPVYLNEQQAASGIAGVGLTIMLTGIENKALADIITNQLMILNGRLLAEYKLPQDVLDKATAFTFNAIQEAVATAALRASRILGDNSDELVSGGPLVDTVFSISLAESVRALLSSSAIENATRSYLLNAGLSDEAIAAVQPALDATISSGIAQFTTSQIGNATGIQGILPQVLGNLPSGSDEFQRELLSSLSNQIPTTLENSATITSLQSTLANSLSTQDTLNRATLQEQINRGIASALRASASYRDLNSLNEALQASFRQQNFSQETAQTLANEATTFVASEESTPNLDRAYTPNTNQETIVYPTQEDIVLSEQLQSAIDAANERTYQTNRQYRGALVQELQDQGVSTLNAYVAANNLLRSQRTQEELQTALNKSTLNQIENNRDSVIGALTPTINTISAQLASSSLPTTPVFYLGNVQDQQVGGENTQKPFSDSETAANALSRAINQTLDETVTNRLNNELQVNIALSARLQAEGIERTTAENLSRTLVATLNNRITPLDTPTVGFVDRSTLQDLITSRVVYDLNGATSQTRANELGTLLSSLLVGNQTPTEKVQSDVQRTDSLLDILDKNHETLRVAYANRAENAEMETYRIQLTYLANPTIKTATDFNYFVRNRLLDPAYALTLTGIMYDRPMPSNYKKSIDIPI